MSIRVRTKDIGVKIGDGGDGDESLDREYENHKEKISFRTKVLGVKTENKEKDESLYEGYEHKY